MGGKPRVDRSPEEKWQIVQEGIKSGNVSGAVIGVTGSLRILFYRWKDEAEQGARQRLGEKRCRGGRPRRITASGSWHRRTLGRKALEIEILKNVVGE